MLASGNFTPLSTQMKPGVGALLEEASTRTFLEPGSPKLAWAMYRDPVKINRQWFSFLKPTHKEDSIEYFFVFVKVEAIIKLFD